MIALDLRVYAQANEATVHHLCTRNGDHQLDFIIERDDRKIVALEVKPAPRSMTPTSPT